VNTILSINNFLLIDNFTINKDYSLVEEGVKKDLDNKFFKGYFGRDESVLYYRSDFLTIPGFTRIPAMQVHIIRDAAVRSETKIQFKVIPALTIIFLLSVMLVWSLYVFDVGGLRRAIIFPASASLFFYGILFLRYKIELSYFKNEIEKM
jgi:hypothetical protein